MHNDKSKSIETSGSAGESASEATAVGIMMRVVVSENLKNSAMS